MRLLYVMQADGRNARVVTNSVDLKGAPAGAPDGSFFVYSGPDIGTTFAVKAVTAEAAPHPSPPPDPDSGGLDI
jgi:hypothetical protein